jgi:dihydroxyacetone kinase-like protein
MAGFSISLLKLDDELKSYYDMPARSLSFVKAP